jgi:hypothetical protein
MINNQIEQLATVENTFFEKISLNAHKTCAITTRNGVGTQILDYPVGHPKRVEHIKKKKSLKGNPQ